MTGLAAPLPAAQRRRQTNKTNLNLESSGHHTTSHIVDISLSVTFLILFFLSRHHKSLKNHPRHSFVTFFSVDWKCRDGINWRYIFYLPVFVFNWAGIKIVPGNNRQRQVFAIPVVAADVVFIFSFPGNLGISSAHIKFITHFLFQFHLRFNCVIHHVALWRNRVHEPNSFEYLFSVFPRLSKRHFHYYCFKSNRTGVLKSKGNISAAHKVAIENARYKTFMDCRITRARLFRFHYHFPFLYFSLSPRRRHSRSINR